MSFTTPIGSSEDELGPALLKTSAIQRQKEPFLLQGLKKKNVSVFALKQP